MARGAALDPGGPCHRCHLPAAHWTFALNSPVIQRQPAGRVTYVDGLWVCGVIAQQPLLHGNPGLQASHSMIQIKYMKNAPLSALALSYHCRCGAHWNYWKCPSIVSEAGCKLTARAAGLQSRRSGQLWQTAVLLHIGPVPAGGSRGECGRDIPPVKCFIFDLDVG